MKLAIFALLVLACLVAALAAPEKPAPPPAAAADSGLYSLIGGDYKKPQDVPEGFFNPFKVPGAGAALQKKEGAAVTNESVAAAVAHREVSGLLFAAAADKDRVIIGDQVFGVGDELAFPDGDKGGLAPLVAGASVVLREVGPKSLALDITPDGEATRRFNYSLGAFLRP